MYNVACVIARCGHGRSQGFPIGRRVGDHASSVLFITLLYSSKVSFTSTTWSACWSNRGTYWLVLPPINLPFDTPHHSIEGACMRSTYILLAHYSSHTKYHISYVWMCQMCVCMFVCVHLYYFIYVSHYKWWMDKMNTNHTWIQITDVIIQLSASLYLLSFHFILM